MPNRRSRGLSEAFTSFGPVAAGPICSGFVVCPPAISPHAGHFGGAAAELYRLAYEQARDALRPPRHTSQLFASMN
jgi:hypothetical protein